MNRRTSRARRSSPTPAGGSRAKRRRCAARRTWRTAERAQRRPLPSPVQGGDRPHPAPLCRPVPWRAHPRGARPWRRASPARALHEAGFERRAAGSTRRRPMALGPDPKPSSAPARGGRGLRFAVGACSLGAGAGRIERAGRGGDHAGRRSRDAGQRALQVTASPRRRADRRRSGLPGGVSPQVVGFVEAPAIGLDLPLDIRGTAFQQRVWQRIARRSRLGETASYAEIARADRRADARAARLRAPAPPRPTRSPSRSPAIAASSAATAACRAIGWGVERNARAARPREAQPA